jgi:hypothetical protein
VATLEDLVAVERKLWDAAGGDDAGYAALLADGALHVFPGVGVLDRDAVLRAVAAATPWESYTIDDPRLVDLGDGAAALVYRTRAQRAGASAYIAAMTSVYVRRDGSWFLAAHQQTPLPE